jgi:alkaline phosphatase D
VKVFLLLLLSGCAQQTPDEPTAEYAPADAYLEGSKHPYYGSENRWDRRFFGEQTKTIYGRRGQKQMLDIIEGRTTEAARYCRELLAQDPQDLESLFNLAVAEARLGNTEVAVAVARRSVEAGLPIERYFAGPRDILQPLVDSQPFKSLASQHRVELIHGPTLGSLTDTTARFWVRTLNEVPVQVLVSTSSNLSNPIRSAVRSTLAGSDYTAVVEVQGLQPDTLYSYDLLISGKPALAQPLPSFRTYPQPGSKSRHKVGFGGGAGYTPSNERMWNLIASYEPAAFLFLGDNVYIDMPQAPNGLHYYTYYQRQSRLEFRKLVSGTNICAIWDDHDCAIDDVWMGPYKDKPSWKMPLFRVFQENWNNPAYGDPEWPGCWFEFSMGDVDFFMLEGRFYRTNPFEQNPTMLGPVQKSWLKDQLKRSSATFKVIASPVPWSYDAKPGVRDTWNGFRSERDELFDFLADNKIEGVVLISADRHRSDAWRIQRAKGYPLYEFESSRLTNEHVHELMPGALFGYNQKQSFGLLTLDTTLTDPTVTFQIVSIDNEVINTLSVKRSELAD